VKFLGWNSKLLSEGTIS
jgi:hypothetical protein